MVTSKDGTEEAKVVEQYRQHLAQAKVSALHRTAPTARAMHTHAAAQ